MTRACAAVICALVLSSGCTSQEPAAPESGGAAGTDPSTAPTDRTPRSLPPPSERLRVEVTSRVGTGPETQAFTSYLRARTESFRTGSSTPALRAQTTKRELRRQQMLVTSAMQSGFTVPARPRAAVVDRHRVTATATLLQVCLYLPSTEYVDKITGESPYGDVPRRWQAAVVRLVNTHVTWKVDKVVPPPDQGGSNCRGLD